MPEMIMDSKELLSAVETPWVNGKDETFMAVDAEVPVAGGLGRRCYRIAYDGHRRGTVMFEVLAFDWGRERGQAVSRESFLRSYSGVKWRVEWDNDAPGKGYHHPVFQPGTD